MEYYYLSAIKEDVKNYIDDEITISDFSDRDELESYLNDELWTCDSVTGNASGSYTMNRLTAILSTCILSPPNQFDLL